ncbi:MAG: YlxR family protein [Chloroflexi bacterium]|nr:YlxR family protein [Chloroflexota bacterium]
MTRRKHIPQRMCVVCRQSQDKKSLVRLVKTPQGIFVDETGKLAGRGAYLHADASCWEQGVLKYLQKALKTTLNSADRERLIAHQASFTEENES